MSLRALDDGPAVPRAFDVNRLGAMTWLGLVVAALGWTLLLGAAGAGAKLVATAHADLVEIARCLIGSGFALALIGALRTGFGTLDRFFAAVLTRSAPRATPAVTPMPTPASPAMPVGTPEPVPATPAAPSPLDRSAPILREKRPYQILADGSVEVETIVGTRRFETMEEARDFI